MDSELTQQVIKRVNEEHYGDDLRSLFDFHGWEWQGNQSMNASATLIKNEYGNIKNFDEAHAGAMHKVGIFARGKDVLVSSFWRWLPQQTGGWDFRGQPTRQKVIDKTSDTFILLVYITNRAAQDQKYLENQVVGFLEVTHQEESREELDSPDLEYPHRESYNHSLKAVRAFEFLPDSRPNIFEIIPDLREREQMIHELNEGIEPSAEAVELLKSLSYREVPLFGSENNFRDALYAPQQTLLTPSPKNGEFGNPLSHIMAKDKPNVWLTTFYGWSPSEWGCAGFTAENQAKTFRSETDEGVLLVIYGAKNKRTPKELRGKVIGIYQLSHTYGLSENFLSPVSIRENEERGEGEKWKYAYKCERAWEIVAEQRPDIEDFAPETYALGGHQHLGSQGRRLTRAEAIRLLEYDWQEVSVYGGKEVIESFPAKLSPSKAGPIGKKVGSSSKEPDGEREIYILKLTGDTTKFLGISKEKLSHRWVVKAGLSKSPSSRLKAFNDALPACAFKWEIIKSTRRDNDPYIPDGESAKIVEREFQEQILKSKDVESLGGEFFLAHPDDIENAWHFSRVKAKKFQNG